jgi:uncharacterized membrane protein
VTALAQRLQQPDARPFAVALTAAVFLVSWGLVHRGFYAGHEIVDTGLYADYGERITSGDVPYRDFAVEYPPGALPAFVLPSLVPGVDYATAFEWLMAAFGVALVVVLAQVRLAAAAFVALSPLLVGSLILSRFDLWPALLTTVAVLLLARDRHALGWAFLGVAAAAKLYPLVLVPLALVWTYRRARLRDALAGAASFAAIVVPFFVLAPSGVWHSVYGQASRPLQIESLFGSIVRAVADPRIVTTHGSQNIAGFGWLATVTVVLQLAVLAAIWLAFARRPDDLVRFSAAAIVAFIAFGKVLSPQFLIWLLPLVPLVRGRRGLTATALLACALVLTQVWFPERYWQYVFDGGLLTAVVVARDLVLVGLVGVLASNR